MIRAVLLCALVICAQGDDLTAPKVQYAQRARSLRKGVEQLEADVLRNRTEYEFAEPPLHYVLLVAVVSETADIVNNEVDPDLIVPTFLEVLEDKVPDILEKPQDAVDKLYTLLVDNTLDRADPLLKVIDEVCEGNGADDQCNRVVEKLVQSDTELQYSATVLDAAGQVTDAYLAKQPRLKEVANNFQVIPYLLQNEESVKDFVVLELRLLNAVYPIRKRTD